jgi:adenylate cyclase
LAYAERALDADPESSLSLAISGLVRTHMSKEHAVAEECYDRAVQINPSDSLAWILRGVLQAFKGNGIEAVSSTQRALKLSPLDPLRYYYDCLAATAFAANHQYENAIDLAQRSARANKFHASTFRTLAFAQWFAGRHDEARATVRWLLQLEPNLTVGRYLERSPAAVYETGKAWANALREAGLPN